MPAGIRELFPFGDVDAEVLRQAETRFGNFEAGYLASAIDLGKAVVTMLERMSAPLEEAGISPARWRLLLALLFQAGPAGATIGELAGHLGVSAPTVTTTVNRAERQGLVARHRDAGDGRVVRVQITSEGVSLVVSLQPALAARLHAFVESLGGPEAATLISRSLLDATEVFQQTTQH